MIDGRPCLCCDVVEVELLFRDIDRFKQRFVPEGKVMWNVVEGETVMIDAKQKITSEETLASNITNINYLLCSKECCSLHLHRRVERTYCIRWALKATVWNTAPEIQP
jgi:hypothetical protein